MAGEAFARLFSLDHFMFMGKLVRRGRPDLYLNKHYFTRRNLNLDDEGHAYRYLPPKYLDSRSHGQYQVRAPGSARSVPAYRSDRTKGTLV